MVKYAFSILLFSIAVFIGCVGNKKIAPNRIAKDTLVLAEPISSIIHPYNNVNFQLALSKKNITFYAIDSINSWELFISKDTNITFLINDVQYFFSNSMHSNQGDSIIKYYSLNGNQRVLILIEEKPYTTRLKKSNYPFSVKVFLKNLDSDTEYNGDGFYVTNPNIHDIWVLDSLNGQKIKHEYFLLGLPQLEFHLDGGRMMGFGGCNELEGIFYTIEDEIQFNSLVGSPQICGKANDEHVFLNTIQYKRFLYTIENLRLRFTHRDGSVIVFRKVD